nr:nuclease-related domain-containing protein [Cellulomonas hominis]
MRQPGQVIGRAGTGLGAGCNGWAANRDVARIGRRGELRTGEVLNQIAAKPGGPTVLHDLTIPGSRANIDHVVVSGRRITLVDSKVWKPGTYWRLPGIGTFRGAERFPYADKGTMAMAVDRLVRFLDERHLAAQVAAPLTVVWPSSREGSVRMLAFGGDLARRRVIPGPLLASSARRLGSRTADPNVVFALAPLVAGAAGARSAHPTRPVPSW